MDFSPNNHARKKTHTQLAVCASTRPQIGHREESLTSVSNYTADFSVASQRIYLLATIKKTFFY